LNHAFLGRLSLRTPIGSDRLKEAKVRTYDMGGKESMLDVAKAMADYAT
jgi:hypothetical protein